MYVAFYRRYRPRLFSEVIGQEPIIQTLKNQVASGHVSHAYLFCGSRGTGKTSTAKILARAINCQSPIEGEPCGQCPVCRMSEEELAVDILEIDAASNNGVDEIRDLREKVRYAPAVGKYKVYIIDEVHMLSTGAFNALLKTLEEPPAHAVFILATTETHKLPATILSRCQRFDFKRLPESLLVQQMEKVLSEEGIQADRQALALIASQAQGGMRDALSLLDQCAGMSGGEITLEKAQHVLGAAGSDQVERMAQSIADRQVRQTLAQLQQIYDNGADLSVFVREMIDYYRERMIECAEQAEGQWAMEAMLLLAQAETDMKLSPRPKTQLEAALVKLCVPKMSQGEVQLLKRIEALEKAVQHGQQMPAIRRSSPMVETMQAEEQAPPWEEVPPPEEDLPPWEQLAPPPLPKEPAPKKQKETPEKSTPAPSRVEDLLDTIFAIFSKRQPGAAYFLKRAEKAWEDGSQLWLQFDPINENLVQALRQFQQDLEQSAEQALGHKVEIQFKLNTPEQETKPDIQDVLKKAQQAFGLEIEIEE